MASPRIAQTRKDCMDEKVFRATVDLLRTAGTGAVTVEAVSARSGVAKTTIYCRSRRSLVQMCWRASGLPSPELRQRPIEACGATYTGPGVTADGNVVTANESMSSRLFGQKINEVLAGQHPPGDSRQVAITLAPPRNRAIAGEMATPLILSCGSPALFTCAGRTG